MKQFYKPFILFLLVSTSSLASRPFDTTALYKSYVKETISESYRINKLFRKSIKSGERQDSNYCVEVVKLQTQYLSEIEGLTHLLRFETKRAVKQYQDAQLHNSLITEYYSKLLDLAIKSNSPISAKTRFIKNALYAQGKKKYRDKVTNKKILDGLHKIHVSKLKQNQSFTYEKSPTNKSSSYPFNKSFNLKFSDNLQTNMFVNGIFRNDKTGELKKRKDDAIATNGLTRFIDSKNIKIGVCDSQFLFSINPYRFRPLFDRLKFGFDNQIKESISGKGILLINVSRITYLLHPKIVPVLSLGFETQCVLVDKYLVLKGFAPVLRFGFESKIHPILGLFVNYENSWSGLLNNDGFVVGVTNSGGDKRLFNYWIGINTNNTFSGQGSPLVFRIGF